MDGRVLIIAGSDPSGGAGLQADIKTVSALGAYAAAAVSMVTVQDTHGVQEIFEIPASVVGAQVRVVLADIGADAIKIGAVGNADIIAAIAEEIDRADASVSLVVDPVMVAKDGHRLLGHEALSAFKAELAVRARVLTPNIPEAEILAGSEIFTVDDMKVVAERLLTLGAEAVLVKGGHLAGDTVTDVLMTLDDTHVFTAPRIDTRQCHGTGCTLASAVATGLAQGMALVPAVERARAYVLEALRTAPGLGKGYGPLNHLHNRVK